MNKRGFTLLEMLVVVSITLGVMGAIVVNYNSFNDTQKLRQAALSLKSNLRLAQSRAVSGVKPNSGCTSLAGYRVTFAASSYVIQAVCTEGLVGQIVDTQLPAGVTFSPAPGAVTYAVITGTAAGATTITMSAAGRTYGLQVSASGDINDQGIQ